jgi:hypothetical protein
MGIRHALLVIALSGAVVVLDGPAAHACSCAAGPIGTGLGLADAAFIGTVARVPDLDLGDVESSLSPVTWEFDVESVLKGELPARVDVTTAISGASCGFEGMARGDRVGVLLERANGEWKSGLCSQVDADELGAAGEARPPSTSPPPTSPGTTSPPDGRRAAAVAPAADDDPPWWLLGGRTALLAIGVGGAIRVQRRRRRPAN